MNTHTGINETVISTKTNRRGAIAQIAAWAAMLSLIGLTGCTQVKSAKKSADAPGGRSVANAEDKAIRRTLEGKRESLKAELSGLEERIREKDVKVEALADKADALRKNLFNAERTKAAKDAAVFSRTTVVERAQERVKHAGRREKGRAMNALKGAKEALKKTQAALEAAAKDQAKFETALGRIEDDLAADEAILKQLKAKQDELKPQIAGLEKRLAR